MCLLRLPQMVYTFRWWTGVRTSCGIQHRSVRGPGIVFPLFEPSALACPGSCSVTLVRLPVLLVAPRMHEMMRVG